MVDELISRGDHVVMGTALTVVSRPMLAKVVVESVEHQLGVMVWCSIEACVCDASELMFIFLCTQKNRSKPFATSEYLTRYGLHQSRYSS